MEHEQARIVRYPFYELNKRCLELSHQPLCWPSKESVDRHENRKEGGEDGK